MTQPQALLLDAMGTLIGLRQSVGTLYGAAAADYGLELEAEALDRAFAQAYSQAPPLTFPGWPQLTWSRPSGPGGSSALRPPSRPWA